MLNSLIQCFFALLFSIHKGLKRFPTYESRFIRLVDRVLAVTGI